jgi:3D (Asp-Asp-Asp) domain-containing protein
MIKAVLTALYLTTVTIFGQDVEMQEVKISCYLPTGNRTYSGQVPYVGGCAVNKDHLGQTAMLFDAEYRFIGFYEVNDIGGNKLLRQGKAIDIFQETMEEAREFIKTNGDKGFVIWLEADG